MEYELNDRRTYLLLVILSGVNAQWNWWWQDVRGDLASYYWKTKVDRDGDNCSYAYSIYCNSKHFCYSDKRHANWYRNTYTLTGHLNRHILLVMGWTRLAIRNDFSSKIRRCSGSKLSKIGSRLLIWRLIILQFFFIVYSRFEWPFPPHTKLLYVNNIHWL